MKTPILMSAMILGVALSGLPAAAAGFGDRPDFATLDQNGDGSLSREELANAGAARFAAVDTDGDGALSAEELAAAGSERMAKRAERMIERLDSNDDGMLQQAELEEAREGRGDRMFDRIDRDDDGAISAEEFEEVKERHGRGGKGHRGGKGGRG